VGACIFILFSWCCAELVVLAVRRDFRRQGLDRRLLIFVIDEASAASMPTIFSYVRPTNKAALTLCTSAGFCQKSIVKNYYQGGPGILMHLALCTFDELSDQTVCHPHTIPHPGLTLGAVKEGSCTTLMKEGGQR